MKLLSWNIQQGGGTRLERILNTIEGHKADVVVLTEYREKRGPVLKVRLQQLGYKQIESTTTSEDGPGVLIASKGKFEPLQPSTNIAAVNGRWLEVSFRKEGFILAGLYMPDTAPGLRRFWPHVISAAERRRGDPYLMVGDFNSGLAAFDAEAAELSGEPWFAALPYFGFTDLWRKRHRSKLEHTWFSNAKSGKRNGFRIDHAFGSKTVARRIRSCDYSHGERLRKDSDHSALLLHIR